jgi:hypothetical protein
MERGSTILMVRAIPAHVCHTCGEKYFADETTSHLLRMADDAARAGTVGTTFRVYSEVG